MPCFNFLEPDHVLRDPLAIGEISGQFGFQFRIIVNLAFLCIDKKHFTRFQASFFLNLLRSELKDSCLRAHYNKVVSGEKISRRPQSVPVEHPADIPSVREYE